MLLADGRRATVDGSSVIAKMPANDHWFDMECYPLAEAKVFDHRRKLRRLRLGISIGVSNNCSYKARRMREQTSEVEEVLARVAPWGPGNVIITRRLVQARSSSPTLRFIGFG
ncbi:hypothetical protein HKBW3S09_01526 [Candidatus Hakubella thermalkaliphila]|uniref:Uncharacterized protein n=1 Tax=Candidatus Hakubella thermalkaliphila TaxID=2754717 RepID=A0A6V8NX78_9ACTN|nr:hypothetical protein HKBW3S09_01526 [Candidatus Hakubella thermalkaliphila]